MFEKRGRGAGDQTAPAHKAYRLPDMEPTLKIECFALTDCLENDQKHALPVAATMREQCYASVTRLLILCEFRGRACGKVGEFD